MEVAFIVVVPSSAKAYDLVSFLSSKYGFSEKFCISKQKGDNEYNKDERLNALSTIDFETG